MIKQLGNFVYKVHIPLNYTVYFYIDSTGAVEKVSTDFIVSALISNDYSYSL